MSKSWWSLQKVNPFRLLTLLWAILALSAFASGNFEAGWYTLFISWLMDRLSEGER